MPVVKLDPTDEFPVPFSTDDEEAATFMDELTVSANTADVLEALGAPLEVDPATFKEEKKLIDSVVNDHKTAPLKNYGTSLAISGFLKTYGNNLAFDVNQVRAALTNKLLEIADCGDAKYELKAIEMLGKHSDIALFKERSEININYNSPEALENAIKERVKRLLNADVIDMTPLGADLDEELGVYERKLPLPYEEQDESPESSDDA